MSGRAAALALGTLLALLLGAGEARAQTPSDPRNQCGALSSGAATCSDRGYGLGIRYDVNTGWIDGVAGDVALTVTGGAATTIDTPTVTGFGSGIVVRTAAQGAGDSTTRTIELTVGSGSNAVVIAQSANTISANFDNTGVVIHQRGAAADATTVTLGSGVKIGSQATPMKLRGVEMLVEMASNTGDHGITSAAAIHTTEWGLLLDARGSGDTSITNSGSITTTATGGAAHRKSGIRILDWSGTRGDERTAATTTTITNSGSITTSAEGTGAFGAHGVHVDADGSGLYKVVNSGTITTSGAYGHGILVHSQHHTGAAGSEAVEIESSGDITTSGESAFGILVLDDDGTKTGMGGVKVATTGGKIETSGANAHGIYLRPVFSTITSTRAAAFATGDAVIDNKAAVTASGTGAHGIFLDYLIPMGSSSDGEASITNEGRVKADNNGIYLLGRTAVLNTIDNSGTITAGSHGIQLVTVGAVTATVANSGAITAEKHGIRLNHDGRRQSNIAIDNSGAVTAADDGLHLFSGNFYTPSASVSNSGNIAAGDHGIYAHVIGSVMVTHSAGDVTAATESGIFVRAIYATVMVTGGSVTANGESKPAEETNGESEPEEEANDESKPAVEARLLAKHRKGYQQNNNDGGAAVTISGNAALVSKRGDGVRVWYETPHPGNDGIDITVAEGARVTGARAGIYVSGAGTGADGVLKQSVTVHGTVTGGSDAAVHLVGGGSLTVGETGRVLAGASGMAVLVNEPGPANVVINGIARGGAGADAAVHLTGGGTVAIGRKGRVEANGADAAIRGDAPTTLELRALRATRGEARDALQRVVGGIRGVSRVKVAQVDEAGNTTGVFAAVPVEGDVEDLARLDLSELPLGGFDCGLAMDRRCELYEALPSALLSMTRLPSLAERMAAPRGTRGVWGRVEAARGEWAADEASSAKEVSYDHGRAGGRAGVDFRGGGARFGLSVHMLRGKADMSGVGEIALNGVGAGASATWTLGDFYLDAQAQATWLDAELDSAVSGKLEKEAAGLGGALGVEAGRRMDAPFMEGLFITPRLGLAWTMADLGDFTDPVGSPAARVSVEDARSFRGSLGVTIDRPMANGGRLFGTLDVEQEFADETSVGIANLRLKTDVPATTARLGVGGAFSLSGGVTLTLSGRYETSGSDAKEYGGSASLKVSF